MKTKILLFLFLAIPILAFSQASLPLISSNATYDGVLYNNGYGPQVFPNFELGNVAGSGSIRGRGFAKFDLSSITFSNQDMLHSAYLVFTCSGSTNNSKVYPTVDIGKSLISDII